MISTQWRVGFGGIYALDYAAIKAVLDAFHIPFKQVVCGLQVIEHHIVKLAAQETG